MAVNCCVVPGGIEAPAGVTVIDVSVGPDAITVSIAEGDVIEPDDAVMLAVPGAIPLANPLLPEMLLIVATDGVLELHVTKLVMFWLVPSA